MFIKIIYILGKYQNIYLVDKGFLGYLQQVIFYGRDDLF